MSPATAPPPPIGRREEVTPEWLAAVVTAAGDGGPVELSVVEEEPVGHGMVGDTYRYRLTYAAGAGPASVVVKLSARDPESRQTGFRRLLHQREVGFYSHLAPTLGVRAPGCLLAAIDAEREQCVLVLEDMAPAEPGDQIAGCNPDRAAVAMEQAAALHAPRWGDPALERLEWLHIAEANVRVFTRLTRRYAQPFAEQYAELLWPETAGVCSQLARDVERYYARHSRPWTIQHSDFRLDNILWDAKGGTVPMALVDWQTIILGPGIADVSYFLGGGLLPDVRRAHERELVRLYHEALLAGGVRDYPWERCWREYRLFAYAGLLNAIAPALMVRRTERGDSMFTTMANRHARQALDLDAAALLHDDHD